MNKQFKGTGVAIVTPFNTDTSIDFNSLTKLVEHLIDGGVNYLVVLGTTGESATLNKEEKRQVVDHVIKVNQGRLPVVVGHGGNNTQGLIDTINAFDFDGVDAILSVSPAYNKPTQEGIYQHYAAISKIAPKPIILYNVPSRTASNMEPETTIRLAQDFDNIVAIKDATSSLDQIIHLVANKANDFTILSGDDGLVFTEIKLGIHGVVSVMANVLPQQFSTMINLALGGKYEEAEKVNSKLMALNNLLYNEGNPAGIKAALVAKGIIKSDTVRLPLVSASEVLSKGIKKELTNIMSSTL